MANKTTNYELVKPLASEFYDIEVQNGNMDKIDAEMKANADKIKTHASQHATSGSDPITPASIGAAPAGHTHNYAGSSSAGGSATSAVKLSTARTIRTNLGSTGTASFDGTSNVTPGVTGTLPVANGGTGATTAAAARTNIGAVSIDDVNKAISDAIGTVIGGSY